MKNALKVFTQELRDQFLKAVSTDTFLKAIETIKAASESGTFKVVVSTDNVDRSGEIVNQNGWDLTHYKKNPIVLWAHDYGSLPIGMCTKIEVVNNQLIAEGVFAPAEANPFAQQVRKLYDAGMISATSVGFIPTEMDGSLINKAELLEFSFVPVPANAYALRLNQIKDLNLDIAMFATKGITIKEESEQVVPPATEPEKPKDEVVPPAAEPEKPKEEVPPVAAPADEQKGALADEVAIEDMREQKYEKLNDLWEVFDAFCMVYMDEATAVEAYDGLLKELVVLLQNGMPAETDEAAKGAIAARVLADKKAGKKGARASLKTAIDTAKKAIAAMEGQLGASAGSEGKEQGGAPAPNKKVVASGVPANKEEVKDFLVARDILKEIAEIVSASLGRINERGRAHAKRKQQ